MVTDTLALETGAVEAEIEGLKAPTRQRPRALEHRIDQLERLAVGEDGRGWQPLDPQIDQLVIPGHARQVQDHRFGQGRRRVRQPQSLNNDIEFASVTVDGEALGLQPGKDEQRVLVGHEAGSDFVDLEQVQFPRRGDDRRQGGV
ncbi:MAG: Uncharacterised protein [Rhodospirillaceae bacterium]|nr:MAG: Uncharacterised protein [Rhodospirillaceae bacterium]